MADWTININELAEQIDDDELLEIQKSLEKEGKPPMRLLDDQLDSIAGGRQIRPTERLIFNKTQMLVGQMLYENLKNGEDYNALKERVDKVEKKFWNAIKNAPENGPDISYFDMIKREFAEK